MTEQHQLPDRDHGWDDPVELGNLGLTVAFPAERPDFPRGGGYLQQKQCAYILEGVDEYLGEHADRVIDVPSAYKHFEDFETYLGAATIDAGSNYVGHGIHDRQLEPAVRFATGGGRFRSGDLTVTGCGARPFIVQYDGHAYLVATARIRGPFDLSSRETHEVAGFEIVEDDPNIRFYLETMFEHLDALGVDVVGYDGLYPGKHIFEQANGRQLYVKTHDVKKLNGVTDPGAMEGDHVIETSRGEELHVSWDEIEYEIGDTFDDWYLDDVGIVAGYQIKWEDPRTSSRVSMTGKITVDAAYKVLRFVEKDSYDEIKVREEKERLGRFDAEGWKPIGSNLR